ncbi:hypothetical protein E2542_SST01425 [Spatholobus suberectus]|nr:hypothetical protein E2542_SST01425 [Spatholobus suberectus]
MSKAKSRELTPNLGFALASPKPQYLPNRNPLVRVRTKQTHPNPRTTRSNQNKTNAIARSEVLLENNAGSALTKASQPELARRAKGVS